jgi:aldehyde:ferredoxin oxidoreductase
MPFGNMGKVLEVDLTTGKTSEFEPDEEVYRDYIGGAGLAAKLLFDRGNLDAEPLDPDSLLIFATGPLTGIGWSGSSRLSVGARSPLTGIWGQASCGGNFGPELKRCGYDAVIFKGKAENPVYLLLEDDKVELVPASDRNPQGKIRQALQSCCHRPRRGERSPLREHRQRQRAYLRARRHWHGNGLQEPQSNRGPGQ